MQLRWLPLTESTQIFLCDSVCVSSTWVRGPRGPRGPRGVRKKIEKKNNKNLAALFRKVDPSPALVVLPPPRRSLVKMLSGDNHIGHIHVAIGHVHYGQIDHFGQKWPFWP